MLQQIGIIPVFHMQPEIDEKDGKRGDGKMAAANQGQVIESRALFNGRREILIDHDNELYRLIITKRGRLLLNK